MLQATSENCAGDLTGDPATALDVHQRCNFESIANDEQLINQLVEIIKNRGKATTCHKCDAKTALNIEDGSRGKSAKAGKKERK